MAHTCLITGVTGQDGVLLARLLASGGSRVIGTARTMNSPLSVYLGGVANIKLVEYDVTAGAASWRTLLQRYEPHHVVNLAGFSSVADSWRDPKACYATNATAVGDLLDAMGSMSTPPRLVQASSSEIFGPPVGDSGRTTRDEALRPASPYAESKAAAHQAVAGAREEGMAATNLVLFGHTSVLQSRRFALQRIATQAAEVAMGKRQSITLANPSITRDWGSAHDVARAFAAALDADPNDYIIGTGRLHSLREVASWALSSAGSTPGAVTAEAAGVADRPHDFGGRHADITGTERDLRWSPLVELREEVGRMVSVARRRLSTGVDQDVRYLHGQQSMGAS